MACSSQEKLIGERGTVRKMASGIPEAYCVITAHRFGDSLYLPQQVCRPHGDSPARGGQMERLTELLKQWRPKLLFERVLKPSLAMASRRRACEGRFHPSSDGPVSEDLSAALCARMRILQKARPPGTGETSEIAGEPAQLRAQGGSRLGVGTRLA